MRTNIQRHIDGVMQFIPFENDTLKLAFSKVSELILEANQNNIEALCPTGFMETETYDISEEDYIDDYEVLTGTYELELDGEWRSLTEDERESLLDELNEKLQNVDNQITHSETEQPELEKQLEELNDNINTIENADFEYDTVYFNKTWNYYGDDINREVATKLGLAVIQRKSDDQEFLALTGCGMDLSPKIMAYQALTYGYIDKEYTHKLRDIKYVRNVMGNCVFDEVMDKLGITHLVGITEKQAKKRMKRFNQRMQELSELRDKNTDNLIVSLGALAAYNEAR